MNEENISAPSHCGTGKTRLFLDPVQVPELKPFLEISLAGDAHHYLRNVMRCEQGEAVLVFNGRQGEWLALIKQITKKQVLLMVEAQTRPPENLPDIWLVFAPVKRARMDYMAQKATEMGAGVLLPMRTRFTQGGTFKHARLVANTIEAAEQCGLVQVPEVRAMLSLDQLIADWDVYAPDRKIIFCDEKADLGKAYENLAGLKGQPIAIFIGPEGGFSQDERDLLDTHPSSLRISLGPRILRADTALVAALALCQSSIGDWE